MQPTIRHRCGLLAAVCFATTVFAQSPARSPAEALAMLEAGNARFVAGQSVTAPLGQGLRRTLAQGQNPWAIVLCCADSRVPPEHVFNVGLGELFVVRVAGNTCDAETLASVEYAAEHLNAQLCVVLGHEGCGAVNATIAQVLLTRQGKPAPAPSPAIGALLELIQPAARQGLALELGGSERSAKVEELNAQLQARECLRRSQVLQTLNRLQRFRMVAARYHLDSGKVEFLPELPAPAEEPAPAAPTAAAPANLPPHVALQGLVAGNRRFLANGRPVGDISATRREQLTHGQRPFAVVVTCADSRVPPEHIFDAGLGELFVVRVAGNVCNDEVLGSVEYAVEHLGAGLVVVMGHSACGAVKATIAGPHDEHLSANLRALLARIEPSVERARASGKDGDDLLTAAIDLNVQRFLTEARSRSAILRHQEHLGQLLLQPAVYDLATGEVEWLRDDHAAEAAPAPAGETHASGGHAAPGHGTAPAPDVRQDTPAHGETKANGHEAPAGHEPKAEAGHGEAAEPTGHGEVHVTPDATPAAPWRQQAPGVTPAPKPEPQEGAGHEPVPEPKPGHGVDPVLAVTATGVVSLLVGGALLVTRRA